MGRIAEKNKGLKFVVKELQNACHSHEPLSHSMNTPTFNFLLSQIRCKNLKPRGRCCTLDEKILFLTSFKNSPKGYKLLSNIFAVPSSKTLSKLLHSVNFSTGINSNIMDSIHNIRIDSISISTIFHI